MDLTVKGRRELDKRPNRRRWVRRLLVVLGLTIVVAVAGVYLAGSWLTAAAHSSVGPPPSDLNVEAVEFGTDAGSLVRGWYGPPQPGHGVVLLIHGIRGDRRQMLDRARFLQKQGFGVLLFDLHAHGESEGEQITFGIREADSVNEALSYVIERAPGENIGVLGKSLGGAAALLSDAATEADALVIESVYTNVEKATSNRLAKYFGGVGRAGTFLLTAQLPRRLGIRKEDLCPMDAISDVRCPLFVLSGSEDRNTTEEDTRQLYAAACGPKELWLVEGAGHVDLCDYAGLEYERRITAFFDEHIVQKSE